MPTGTVAYTPAQIRAAYGINALRARRHRPDHRHRRCLRRPEHPPGPRCVRHPVRADGLRTDAVPAVRAGVVVLDRLNQNGQATSLPATDPSGPGTDNWEVEEALDVEWTHAIAPGAQIILVEANSQSLSDLMAGVATAASQPGVSVVSMSWGFPEGQAVFASDEAAYDNVFNVPGVTFVASTGDYGAADPEYPAFSPNVVAVGGTSLTLNADSSYNSETGWGYHVRFRGRVHRLRRRHQPVRTRAGVPGGRSVHGLPDDARRLVGRRPGHRRLDRRPVQPRPGNPFEVVGGTSLSAPAWAGLWRWSTKAERPRASDPEQLSPTDTQQALYMLPQSDSTRSPTVAP